MFQFFIWIRDVFCLGTLYLLGTPQLNIGFTGNEARGSMLRAPVGLLNLTRQALEWGRRQEPRKTQSLKVSPRVWLTLACCLVLADGGGQEVKEPQRMAAIIG